MIKLGVNIDHIATLRQARRADEPDPVTAAAICELAGADGITVHLREDRRHIQYRDVELLRKTVKTKLNLEMALSEDIIKCALKIKPDDVCLVPEGRQEITTEGGLDIYGMRKKIGGAITRLKKAGIRVSIFVDADEKQVRAAASAGADCVEIHTGKYAKKNSVGELNRIKESVHLALDLGLILNAGHGLDYKNVMPIAGINGINELNIGFSIISRAVLVGLDRAVREMKELIDE